MSTAEAKLFDGNSEEAPDCGTIEAWLSEYLIRLLKLEQRDVRLDATFDSFGLDSAATVGLTGDLSDWLKIEVDPSLAYDYPNIAALSKHLAAVVRTTG